ncbi:hypothetical protein CLOSTHATH_00544 [Hungatella hathewayi DSM 13479]|uniref:Uncharacterized protein n=1 Tax=Hungatella hathewayi DSM 13479 TaxID=566550 RepID=D3AAC3_9FIRM|nr:hypothetical protein CLOSTHATH_00544 [Hungatella hathewayi DSM 13479]
MGFYPSYHSCISGTSAGISMTNLQQIKIRKEWWCAQTGFLY